MLCRDPIARIPIGELSAGDLASWRDRRSAEVGANSVLREISLLSAVLTQARREWGLIATNPMSDVRKPKKPAPRDRLPQPDELERLAHAAGDDLTTATARAFHAFRFASETAMRAGEIVGLTRDNLDLDNKVAHLPMTKNGHARDVPLSSAAVDLIGQLPPDLDPVFGLTSRQLDVLFRKIKSRALVDGLTFHDSRAAALTMLSRKVDVMTLAKISGHRDLRILQNVYYRETAADIAARLG
jgi:integrase